VDNSRPARKKEARKGALPDGRSDQKLASLYDAVPILKQDPGLGIERMDEAALAFQG
jgi:hypothetical protein